MKDCQGGQHPDDEPVTWRQFDREMEHRDKLALEKEKALQRAVDLRASQMLLSHRILIVIVSILAIAIQVVAFYWKR